MFVRDCGLNIILLGLFDLGIIYEIRYELNIKVLKLGKKLFWYFSLTNSLLLLIPRGG